ncbi:MAG: hypothetical protein LAT76_09860 [Schleiferiaceae bacterium]|nr:hypothetical protein [Schleiferiaceae bacterium]
MKTFLFSKIFWSFVCCFIWIGIVTAQKSDAKINFNVISQGGYTHFTGERGLMPHNNTSTGHGINFNTNPEIFDPAAVDLKSGISWGLGVGMMANFPRSYIFTEVTFQQNTVQSKESFQLNQNWDLLTVNGVDRRVSLSNSLGVKNKKFGFGLSFGLSYRFSTYEAYNIFLRNGMIATEPNFSKPRNRGISLTYGLNIPIFTNFGIVELRYDRFTMVANDNTLTADIPIALLGSDFRHHLNAFSLRAIIPFPNR